MRRGYTRESYLSLIEQVRAKLPNATISSDFISGFCGENEADHQQTLSLLREVRFDRAFMFAYSLREKTHAHRSLKDDVPEHIKQRRLQEVVELFNAGARAANEEEESRTKPPFSLVVFLPLLPFLPFLSFVTPHSSHLSHATFFPFVTRDDLLLRSWSRSSLQAQRSRMLGSSGATRQSASAAMSSPSQTLRARRV